MTAPRPAWLEHARAEPAEVKARQLEGTVNDPHALGAALTREANSLAAAAEALRKAVDSDGSDVEALADALVDQFSLFDRLARCRREPREIHPQDNATTEKELASVLAEWKQLYLETQPHDATAAGAWWVEHGQ